VPFSLFGWGNFDFPLIDRLMKRRHTALVLRALSLVVKAGTPMSEGVSTLAGNYPTKWIRRKLVEVDRDVSQGGDWIESLESHGIIRSADAQVLRSAGAVGNLDWAMTELADSCERRLAVRFQTALQLVFPLIVMALGFLVFLFAVAYFAPLVKLISEFAHE
jgi:type II secretory pathway component PulF